MISMLSCSLPSLLRLHLEIEFWYLSSLSSTGLSHCLSSLGTKASAQNCSEPRPLYATCERRSLPQLTNPLRSSVSLCTHLWSLPARTQVFSCTRRPSYINMASLARKLFICLMKNRSSRVGVCLDHDGTVEESTDIGLAVRVIPCFCSWCCYFQKQQSHAGRLSTKLPKQISCCP